MINVAHFEAELGETKHIPPEKISGAALSTHALPLYVLAEIIQENANAKIMLLGCSRKM